MPVSLVVEHSLCKRKVGGSIPPVGCCIFCPGSRCDRERWSHNPKVVSSILTPGNFAWMNSEGSGLGLQIQGGLTSQWFKSTFCAYVGILLVEDLVSKAYGRKKDGCSMRGSNPRPLAHKTNTLPTELMEPVCLIFAPIKAQDVRMRVRGLVVMIVVSVLPKKKVTGSTLGLCPTRGLNQ